MKDITQNVESVFTAYFAALMWINLAEKALGLGVRVWVARVYRKKLPRLA